MSDGTTAPIPNIPYLTDNPFRLLGIGSGTPLADLRRLAKAAERRAQVGLPPERPAGLHALWSGLPEEHLHDVVRAIASNPAEATRYRMFWPFEWAEPPGADGSLEDLDRFAAHLDRPDSFHETQVRFLKSWIRYHGLPDGPALTDAMDAFNALYEDYDCDHYVLGWYEEETGTEDGLNAFYALQEEVFAHLCADACHRMAALWLSGGKARAADILAALASGPISDEHVERAIIRDVVPFGDREASRIRQLADAVDDWDEAYAMYDASEVAPLRALAIVCEPFTAATHDWISAVDARVNAVARSLRRHAIDLHNHQDQTGEALRLVEHALTLPTGAELKALLLTDQSTLRRLLIETLTRLSGAPGAPRRQSPAPPLPSSGRSEPRLVRALESDITARHVVVGLAALIPVAGLAWLLLHTNGPTLGGSPSGGGQTLETVIPRMDAGSAALAEAARRDDEERARKTALREEARRERLRAELARLEARCYNIDKDFDSRLSLLKWDIESWASRVAVHNKAATHSVGDIFDQLAFKDEAAALRGEQRRLRRRQESIRSDERAIRRRYEILEALGEGGTR